MDPKHFGEMSAGVHIDTVPRVTEPQAVLACRYLARAADRAVANGTIPAQDRDRELGDAMAALGLIPG